MPPLIATDISDVLLKGAEQVPALVVLVICVGFLVLKFLSHMREYSDTIKAISENCHALQKEISGNYQRHTDRVERAIEKNTEALGRNTEALRNADTLIHQVRAAN